MPAGRVLIVDDDEDVRVATQDAMERRGYEVVAVTSGAEALGYMAHDTPSLLLLDLEMDDMNGFEVLTELQRNPRFRAVEVVVVTGSRTKLPPGVRVMRKPFKIDALIALIERTANAVAS